MDKQPNPTTKPKTITFMYAPAGKHGIAVNLHGDNVLLWVNVNRRTAAALNQSLRKVRFAEPHLLRFSSSESMSDEAGYPTRFEWRKEGVFLTLQAANPAPFQQPGICCAGCFTVSADLGQVGVVGFLPGKVGSLSRPAEITGVSPGCVGYLTYQPSFHYIRPICKAK